MCWVFRLDVHDDCVEVSLDIETRCLHDDLDTTWDLLRTRLKRLLASELGKELRLCVYRQHQPP